VENFYEIVYGIVKKIPYGKVTSYGHIALLAGKPQAARAVGYALHSIPLNYSKEIPWHRVINAKARISIRNVPGADQLQRTLLEDEGIVFNDFDETDFKRYGWFPL